MGLFNTEVTAILANKLLLPIKVWNNISKSSKKQIKELFIQTTHNPYNCFVHTTNKKCKLKEAAAELGRKPISACFGCKMSEHKDKCMSKSSKYIKFELSNLEANKVLVSILKDEGYDLKFKDIRTLPKLKNPWSMDYSKLDKSRSSEQLRLAKLWNENRNGVLVCPPRFGKTLLTAFVGHKLETRILILVHKIDLARQFYLDYLQFTTLKKSDIEINPDVSKMKKLKVCICTYQQFINKYGKDRLKVCKKLFGLIVVDEIHKAASDEFHRVINSFYARYRLGVTATPKRRDNKQFKNEFTFGPILAKGGAEQLACDYIITNTKWMAPPIPSSDKGWNGLWTKLAKDEHRNNFIAKKVITDLKNNHRIMLPVKRHAQIALLSKLIRKKCRKEGLNVKICEYHGELHKQLREELQKDIRKGKYDVVIGNEQIISLGFNAPPMSCIYINLHTYRTFEEDLYQEFSRIRTQYKKKEKPLIRIFEDIGDLSDKSIQAIEKVMRKYKFNKRQTKQSNSSRSKGGLRCIM